MSMARGSRMLRYINYRMRITLQDARVLVGTFMAFDRHMNIVLGDTEEFRKIRTKRSSGLSEEREEKRALGLIILRGDSVVSLTIEGPPPPELDERQTVAGTGAVKALPARGMPIAPVGLTGQVRGLGGPALSMMQPVQVAAQAPGFPRGPVPGMPPGMPGMPPPGMAGMPPGMPPGMPMPPMGMAGIPRPPGMPMPPMGMPLPPRGPM